MAKRRFRAVGKSSHSATFFNRLRLIYSHRVDRWRPVSDTNSSYALHYSEMLRCIVRGLCGHRFPLPFPLTTDQKDAFMSLIALLRDPTSLKSTLGLALHRVSWLLLSTASQGSWQNIYQFFFALLALRIDGVYAHAGDLSPHLAKLSYSVHLTCMFEALTKPPEEAVEYVLILLVYHFSHANLHS